MFSNKRNFLFATLFSFVFHVQSLVKLRANENIDIANAETAIRETFNTLFSTLKIRNVQNKPRLKQFSTIHNFFISITLKDCDNLKEIEWLSRVNNVDNDTYFITQINEVLDGEDDSEVWNDNSYVKGYVETFIKNLRYLKDNYNLQNNLSNLEINSKILQHLSSDELLENAPKDTSNIKSLDDNLFHDEQAVGQNGRRVYKGISVNIERFPFMASIHFYNEYRCGGCIISRDLIITSSTCLQALLFKGLVRATPHFLSVRIGSTYTESGGEKIGVNEIFFHPHYNPRTLENNLALLRLNRRINFSWTKKNVKRIDFDRRPMTIAEKIIVIGWGTKDNSNHKSRRLSYSLLDYYPLRSCKKVYSEKFVKKYHFCAGFVTKKGGACQYDIGGPGIVDGKISGIINFASMVCGAPKRPTVFTKVGYYSDWIQGIMEQMPIYTSRVFMKNEKNMTSNIQEAAHKYFDIARTDKPIADTKTLQQSVDENGFVSLFHDFEDFVSTNFASRA